MTAPTDLRCGDRGWARAELIPWDSEMFGFPVGRLALQGPPPSPAESAAALESLRTWTADTGSVLTAATVAAESLDWVQALPALGFGCVDLALTVKLTRMAQRPRTLRAGAVRDAVPADHPALELIAGSSFDFGRYHRDPRFPRALADHRFARWVANSLRTPQPGQRFLVLGPVGAPTAFMFMTVAESQADWHLGGVARTAANGMLGPLLWAGVLDLLEAGGVRTVTSKISAANIAVLNLYAALGFRFMEPEFTFHRHASTRP